MNSLSSWYIRIYDFLEFVSFGHFDDDDDDDDVDIDADDDDDDVDDALENHGSDIEFFFNCCSFCTVFIYQGIRFYGFFSV